MANIRVDVNYTIKDGSEIVFRSPVDCSQITGLIVYYPGGDGNTTSKEFALADAHGNNVGDIDHLFAEDVVVKVILDVMAGMAFVQNADTNAYLEGKFDDIDAALNSKAPAGHGYGGAAISLQSSRVNTDEELTTLLESVYAEMGNVNTKLVYWNGYPAGGTSTHGWFGILSRSSANNGGIKAWSANLTGSLVFKVKFSGAWKPLEWQNPPMDVDVEYRTTERYQGKPVYAKCISIGVLPSNAKSTTPHGISDSKHFVALWGHSGRYYFPTQWNADSIGTINIYATSNNVLVKTTETWNNYAAYVTIKYTKQTE